MKVKFFTLGCKVNQYETQGLKEKFLSLGCQETDSKADLYVINTCTVTSRADSKSREAILRAKKDNPRAKIAVCGCLVQLNRNFVEEIGADYIVSQDRKHFLPDIVLGLSPDSFSSGSINKVSNGRNDTRPLKITHFYNHRAFVKVQDGCDNFCSFCKIPYLRGSSRSKICEEAIEEITKVSLLHKEIVLCGVNLSLYGKDLIMPQSLEDLIEGILNIPSLGRLRLSSLEPFFVNKRLFSLLYNDKLCPHFHFPFQYGDDLILKAMNKKDRVAVYEDVVSGARKINPDTAISCDIMVGFPGESEESFQNTVDFLNRIKPMRMHIFTFSPREKTPFSGMKIRNQRVVRKRYNFLKEMADNFSLQYKEKFLGKTLNMITEKENNGFVSGYTENYIKVYIKERIPLGKIFPVKIERIDKDKVFARIKMQRN